MANGIIKRKSTCGGKACIKGTRIRVIDIIERYKLLKERPEEIAMHYDIPVQAVLSALTYYYERPDIVKREIAAEKALVSKFRSEMKVAAYAT